MKFATMQIFEIKEIEQFYKIGSFSGIKFSLRDDPSKLHYCGENGRAWTRIMKYPHEEEDLIDGILAKELIIEGCSEGEAYNLSRFVQAGCLLGYPSISDYPEPRFPHEYDFVLESRKVSKEAEIKTFNYYYADEPIRSNLFIGCSIAKKAYGDLSLMYCLEKYLFSLSLSSVTPHSVHPMYGNLFSSDPQSYSSHVRDVYAFLSAYSIVEELKVEIRSSQSNPRWQDGEWNPKVKKSVLDRLKNIHVDGEDKITFVIRGKEEVLTRQVKEQLGRQSKYQEYEDVYDINLTIVDALHYLSYIRNYYLAHKLSNKVRNISVYDVNNAQMLARYLLLNKFGFWTVPKR